MNDGPVIFNVGAFREAVKRDLEEQADYGTDHTFAVRDRVWRSLYADLPVPEELEDVTAGIVDEEWDWWFEEGPIGWSEGEHK